MDDIQKIGDDFFQKIDTDKYLEESSARLEMIADLKSKLTKNLDDLNTEETDINNKRDFINNQKA